MPGLALHARLQLAAEGDVCLALQPLIEFGLHVSTTAVQGPVTGAASGSRSGERMIICLV